MLRDGKGRFVRSERSEVKKCPKCGGSMVPTSKSISPSYCWFKCGDCGYLDKCHHL